MKIDSNLFNTIKDYTNKVMNNKTFLDYIEVAVHNVDTHKKVMAENFSFAHESESLKSAYDLLNLTIMVMETLLIERSNTFDGTGSADSFENAVTLLNMFLSSDEVFAWTMQKPEIILGILSNVAKIDSANESKPTAKAFFNSKAFEFKLSLLQKMAYEAAETVYGYIEDYTTDSDEIIRWMDECKMYITDWKKLLIDPEAGFDTDELVCFDVLLGSMKIFMTAKVISLLED